MMLEKKNQVEARLPKCNVKVVYILEEFLLFCVYLKINEPSGYELLAY